MESFLALLLGEGKQNFNLTRQFALLSLCCILVIGTISSMMLSRLITDKILTREAIVSQEFVEGVFAAEGTWPSFFTKESKTNNWVLEDFFIHVAQIPDVVRANVYSKDGSILWSSTPDMIGEKFTFNEELDTSLNGELVFESGIIGSVGKEEHDFFDKNLWGVRFIETYIPVWNQEHSEIVGSVELYRVPLMLHQSIVEGRRLIWLGALTGGLLLFISLYWIVKRASLVMETQQQRLLEAESLSIIGKTTSAITHAMRNPLASIRASAELSLTDDLEGVRESAMDIMGETDRLDRWARELLQFSVANTENREQLDINDLVKTVVKEHEPILNRAAISCKLNMVDAPLPVEANFTPLSQVFGNLVVNAVEAMGEHGELTVTTSLDSKGKEVIVSFADNGPGLAQEIKDKLFQPFVTTKPTGTGLGLALSRHLLEHYNGILEFNSEDGQGATATVCLPVSGGLV